MACFGGGGSAQCRVASAESEAEARDAQRAPLAHVQAPRGRSGARLTTNVYPRIVVEDLRGAVEAVGRVGVVE